MPVAATQWRLQLFGLIRTKSLFIQPEETTKKGWKGVSHPAAEPAGGAGQPPATNPLCEPCRHAVRACCTSNWSQAHQICAHLRRRRLCVSVTVDRATAPLRHPEPPLHPAALLDNLYLYYNMSNLGTPTELGSRSSLRLSPSKVRNRGSGELVEFCAESLQGSKQYVRQVGRRMGQMRGPRPRRRLPCLHPIPTPQTLLGRSSFVLHRIMQLTRITLLVHLAPLVLCPVSLVADSALAGWLKRV